MVRVGCAPVAMKTRRERVWRNGRRASARVYALLLSAATLLLHGDARADELDLGLFVAPLGRAATLRIEQPEPERHGTFRYGLVLDYAHDLIARELACGSRTGARGCNAEARTRALVSDLSRADLSVSLALYERFELGLGLPLTLARAAARPSSSLETHFGLADLRFGIGLALADSRATHVGARIDTTFPTASEHSLSGSVNVTVTPSVVITHALSRLLFAAKFGYHVRERVVVYDVEQDDEFVMNLGAAWSASQQFAVLTDIGARLGFGGLHLSAREVAVEIDVGARLRGPASTAFELAVGTNAVPAERSGFVPALRALLSVRGAFEPAADREAPLLQHTRDADGDGFPDDEDACIYDAEDRDGFADDDGCPDRDNDADGLVDAEDACPDSSEDSDGFQDRDGCPEVDNDEDGVADGADRCRLAPEDRDGFEDADGCPEPGPERPVVTFSGSRSLLPDTVYFEGQGDSITAASRPMLDELARTLARLPSHKRVRVEGHTDEGGNRAHNIDLSYRRAKAVVEYLKARGVPAERLEYMGYGGSRPLADNGTPEGRALNRRVQFTVIEATP